MISFSASFPVRKLRTSKKADSIWKLRTGKRSSDIATDVFDDDFNMYDVATVIDADDQIDDDIQVLGLFLKHQPRQPVAIGILLPVEKMLVWIDRERVAEDRRAAM